MAFVHKVVKIHDCDICNKFSYGRTRMKKNGLKAIWSFFSGTTTVNNDLPHCRMHVHYTVNKTGSKKRQFYHMTVSVTQLLLAFNLVKVLMECSENWANKHPNLAYFGTDYCSQYTSMKNLMTMLSSF